MSVDLSTIDRHYRDEKDFWRIRRFLQDTYPITPLGLNWEVRRWDGVMFYAEESGIPVEVAERIHLWEAADERLLGVVYIEKSGDVHLFIHPKARELESDMLEWSEMYSSLEHDGEGVRLASFCLDDDGWRQEQLERKSYVSSEAIEVCRRQTLPIAGSAIPRIAPGYKVSRTQPGDESIGAGLAELLNAAFNRNFHSPREFQTFSSEAPSYLQACDLLAVADDGSYAAYVGICWDDVNKLGIIEPVCTHPDHRRKHLASTLIRIGLQCLTDIGGNQVVVSTGPMEPANRLYESIGFEEKAIGHIWEKPIQGP
jgi:GNAT superfamily N-acetyltransferase